MASETMEDLAEAVRRGDADRARDLVRDIVREREDAALEKFEDLPNVDPEFAKKIQMRGYRTVDKLANAPLEKLVKIPELREGKAQEVLDSARTHVVEKLTELPGVGEDTAEEILNQGYTGFDDLARASTGELAEIPKVGRKSAEKIWRHAKRRAVKRLEDLPGVGEDTAEEMRKQGFTAVKSVAESSIKDLSKIPNVGEKGAEKILNHAESNPGGEIEDLPGVGEETAEEIRNHGHTPVSYVAESFVGELAEIPNIGEKGAEKILKHAREAAGGEISVLPDVDGKTAENIEEHGYSRIEDVAKSSVGKLVKIPGLEEGKAKKVRESAGELVQGGGETTGYIHGLEGIVSGLDSDRKLTLPRKIAEGKYPEGKLEEVKKQMETRASQKFRPAGERSFNRAWSDILSAIIEKEKGSE